MRSSNVFKHGKRISDRGERAARIDVQAVEDEGRVAVRVERHDLAARCDGGHRVIIPHRVLVHMESI